MSSCHSVRNAASRTPQVESGTYLHWSAGLDRVRERRRDERVKQVDR